MTLDADRFVPGSFDHASGRIATAGAMPVDVSRAGGQAACQTEDVLGAIATEVLRHGGDVVSLARSALPDGTGAAAVYRY